jgi:hypothetical protein
MSRDCGRAKALLPAPHAGSPSFRRLRAFSLLRRFSFALIAILSLTNMAAAQSQSAPAQPQTGSSAAKVAEAASQTKSKLDESAPHKVYTNEDLAALSRQAISIPGKPTPPANGAGAEDGNAQTPAAPARPADDTAEVAAYWKARFTAARQKLAQDEKALPELQSQLEIERVQECSVDEDSGQVYSDTFMDLLRQIEAMKVSIKQDKQALSDLHDEFRHAGGEPGWIR